MPLLACYYFRIRYPDIIADCYRKRIQYVAHFTTDILEIMTDLHEKAVYQLCNRCNLRLKRLLSSIPGIIPVIFIKCLALS